MIATSYGTVVGLYIVAAYAVALILAKLSEWWFNEPK